MSKQLVDNVIDQILDEAKDDNARLYQSLGCFKSCISMLQEEVKRLKEQYWELRMEGARNEQQTKRYYP